MAGDGEGEAEAEDARREAALALTPIFQPDFKPSKATQAQLDKLMELHRKRLQLKDKGKGRARPKGSEHTSLMKCEDIGIESSTDTPAPSADGSSDVPASEQRACLVKKASIFVSNKRRKLHWGSGGLESTLMRTNAILLNALDIGRRWYKLASSQSWLMQQDNMSMGYPPQHGNIIIVKSLGKWSSRGRGSILPTRAMCSFSVLLVLRICYRIKNNVAPNVAGAF